MKELDNYEPESADREFHDLNPEAKRMAEKALDRRDKMQQEEEDLDEYIE